MNGMKWFIRHTIGRLTALGILVASAAVVLLLLVAGAALRRLGW